MFQVAIKVKEIYSPCLQEAQSWRETTQGHTILGLNPGSATYELSDPSQFCNGTELPDFLHCKTGLKTAPVSLGCHKTK